MVVLRYTAKVWMHQQIKGTSINHIMRRAYLAKKRRSLIFFSEKAAYLLFHPCNLWYKKKASLPHAVVEACVFVVTVTYVHVVRSPTGEFMRVFRRCLPARGHDVSIIKGYHDCRD